MNDCIKYMSVKRKNLLAVCSQPLCSQLQPKFNTIPRFWDQQGPEAGTIKQLQLCKPGLCIKSLLCGWFCSDPYH